MLDLNEILKICEEDEKKLALCGNEHLARTMVQHKTKQIKELVIELKDARKKLEVKG